jgi:hypothetical protein
MTKEDDLEKAFELSVDNTDAPDDSELERLRRENAEMRKTLEEYGSVKLSPITDIEYICMKAIDDLKKLADGIGLSQDDAKTLDILHKNLRQARGKLDTKIPKSKQKTVGDLLRIVESDKK